MQNSENLLFYKLLHCNYLRILFISFALCMYTFNLIIRYLFYNAQNIILFALKYT